MGSQSVYCFLLVILCCVHLNTSLRLTDAATGTDPLTANTTADSTSTSTSSTTATTTSFPVIHSKKSVSSNNSSINLKEETKTQQGSEITISTEKTTTSTTGPETTTAESGKRKIFPVSSVATNLLAYSSVESNALTVKSNEVGATTEANGSIRSRTKQGNNEEHAHEEEDVGAETGQEGKSWPSIRNCNYTYHSDVDVVYVSCLNHESGNVEEEEVRQEEGAMNPGSGDSLNQVSSPAEPAHIFTPDLSILTLPSSSSSSSTVDVEAAPSMSRPHPADATKTWSTTTSASPASKTATTTLLTVDLLISGFGISSLNQSVFDIMSIDLLNNKTGKEYTGVNMRSLILSNNSISRIRGDCCLHKMKDCAAADGSLLQHLDLSHNLIRELKAEDFDGLQSIPSSLILSYNRLKSIDFLSSSNSSPVNGGIRQKSRLTHLDLRHNRLRVIRESCFSMHPLLSYINLSGNMIDSVDAGSFVSLTHLSHLDLSNNPLTNEKSDKLILTSLSHSLQVINLSNTSSSNNNNSNCIPSGIDPFVRQLILSHNQVSQISPGDFDGYHDSLQTLDLTHNQLVEIEDDALGRLESLRELRLDQNLLSRVPLRLPSNLLILSLDQNSITSLPDSCVSSLTRLQSLHLAANQITNLHPDALTGLTSLVQLNLSSNSISNLSFSMFHDCGRLQSLDISHNPIMILSSYTFSGLNSLNQLVLSHVVTNESMIQMDSGTLTPLISLQQLDLSHSPGLFRALLHSNPQDVDSVNALSFLTSVQQINLDFNEIPELDPVQADALKYWLLRQQGIPQSISLRELEWKCDHSIHWLIKWIKSLNPRNEFASPSSSSPFSSTFSSLFPSCCSYASASHHRQYSTSSSSQPPPSLIPPSSGRETMASDATNSSSGSRITSVSKEPLMQLTSPPPSASIPASASLASTSDPAAAAAAAAASATITGTSSDENEIPPSSASEASSSSIWLDHVTDIICSSPEDLRGRSLLSLTEEELIQMHPHREAEGMEKEEGGKIERGMRMDQNSEATHLSSSVSTSEQGITASSTAKGASASKSEAGAGTSASPSSLSSPPPAPLLVP